ncbi:mycothiol synthase [Frigoribacterium sp. UYMn621]|jgi:mycothiol synthase
MKTTPNALPSPSIPESLARLIERARDADGQPPFSDGALVELRTGAKSLLELEHAAAVYSGTEAEFVVDPARRGAGIGTRLLDQLLERCEPSVKIWAHGDHPAARALAASHDLVAMRELRQLRMPVPFAPAVASDFDRFRPGVDEESWVALNAKAFAFHPEQGSVTVAALIELEAEPWFEADDFIVSRDGAGLAGYCWLKIEDGIGEFYVVGVDPDRQGEGLGRRLMAAGFARLADRGIRTAALYVESDNVPAIALYRSLGFTAHSVDIQYARA